MDETNEKTNLFSKFAELPTGVQRIIIAVFLLLILAAAMFLQRMIRVEEDPEADSWDVASGLLAGAVHFWLYSRQPCGDPLCESCTDIDTAEKRLRMLLDETRQSAEESEYFHTPSDANVGRA